MRVALFTAVGSFVGVTVGLCLMAILGMFDAQAALSSIETIAAISFVAVLATWVFGDRVRS